MKRFTLTQFGEVLGRTDSRKRALARARKAAHENGSTVFVEEMVTTARIDKSGDVTATSDWSEAI